MANILIRGSFLIWANGVSGKFPHKKKKDHFNPLENLLDNNQHWHSIEVCELYPRTFYSSYIVFSPMWFFSSSKKTWTTRNFHFFAPLVFQQKNCTAPWWNIIFVIFFSKKSWRYSIGATGKHILKTMTKPEKRVTIIYCNLPAKPAILSTLNSVACTLLHTRFSQPAETLLCLIQYSFQKKTTWNLIISTTSSRFDFVCGDICNNC